MLVVGDKEIADSTVSIRLRSGEQLADHSFDKFRKTIKMTIANKAKDIV
jgi:threonyl-tRNA synthetase